MSKLIVFKSVNDMPEVPVSMSTMSWNKTGSWRSTNPVHKDITPPCNHSCPAGENIRGYIDLVKKGKTAEAYMLLTDANPFPSVCGRVCYHPCQANCNRHSFDTELQVRMIEKFIGDWGIENDPAVAQPDLAKGKIAIIGAGPAGLAAAYYLRRAGYLSTVFDENSLPGGILHYGIPSHRLPKDILQQEIARMITGLDFKSNMKFGSDFDTGDLIEFDAIFLATGAHRSKKMNLPGDDLSGVESGLEFLKRINSGETIKLEGKKVVVIGGGNTACDVAQTAHRLGGKVSLVYRRTENEMPAFAEEVEELRKEKIPLEFLASPEKIRNGDDGKLIVTFGRMKLGQPDEMGRARPVPVAGSSFDMTVDIVYAAIGEDADLSFFPEVSWESDRFDFSKTDKRIREKLFVGGDILPNPRTVPHAVASGRLAAERIAAYLRGEMMVQPETIAEVAGYEDVNYHYFNRINVAAHISDLSSNGSIESPAKAAEEAARCFSCGVCTECDNCYNFCPDLAVIKTSTGYQVNFDYCKGCGICARECPGGALRMERER